MNKEQLSEAVGGVSEALLDEAMYFEGTRTRRGWSRGTIVAACVAAVLVVSAAAAGVANGWRVRVMPATEYETNLPEDSNAENLLIGDLEVGAYPLPEEVRERIRLRGYGFYESEEYASVAELEAAYGIRLLRLETNGFHEERYVDAISGEFDPADRPEGGIIVSGGWVDQNAGWYADVHFQLCTTPIAADELGGGILYGVSQTEMLTSRDIRSLGVTAQLAVVRMCSEALDANGDSMPDSEVPPEVVVFFAKDDIAYSIVFGIPTQEMLLSAENPISEVSMYPKEAELVDWVCAKLETLHY